MPKEVERAAIVTPKETEPARAVHISIEIEEGDPFVGIIRLSGSATSARCEGGSTLWPQSTTFASDRMTVLHRPPARSSTRLPGTRQTTHDD